ncbi:unnamed protein product [Nesidiocoris tenuis]|uniref:Uncharacterized protein n=1 Tax=Nesidiocoris tenuis TaxID=355587 RepID=A0A6H5GG60_9HEMI|nr:unnamed protein product [Nesidiocoris tenuis]CAB0001982.1 unnamed protein product [Nesidiocoris tenuis]
MDSYNSYQNGMEKKDFNQLAGNISSSIQKITQNGEQLIELVSPTSQREMQMQLQQEEMDLRLIEEQEESIRQLEKGQKSTCRKGRKTCAKPVDTRHRKFKYNITPISLDSIHWSTEPSLVSFGFSQSADRHQSTSSFLKLPMMLMSSTPFRAFSTGCAFFLRMLVLSSNFILSRARSVSRLLANSCFHDSAKYDGSKTKNFAKQ